MFFKKTFLIGLTLLISFTASSQLTFFYSDVHTTKRVLQSLGKQFLNFDPVTVPLSDIVQDMLKNEEIVVDTVVLKTDTSNFYLRGYHKSRNPFALRLDSIRTIIAEVTRKKDGLVFDTVYYLQVEGIAVGQEKMPTFQPYFKTLTNSIQTSFHATLYNRTKKKKQLASESLTCYSFNKKMPLLNITWSKRNEEVTVFCMTFFTYANPPYDE